MAKIEAELAPYIADLVKNAMLTTWNNICADTDCHPLDLEHGRGKQLIFTPRHWAQASGDMVAAQIEQFFKKSRAERAKKIGRFVMTGNTEE